MDLELKLKEFFKASKDSDMMLTLQDMRQPTQSLHIPIVKFIGDTDHCMIVLDKDFVADQWSEPRFPCFMVDWNHDKKVLPNHIINITKEELRFYSRMELVQVRPNLISFDIHIFKCDFLRRPERHFRVFAFNAQSAAKVDTILDFLPMQQWPSLWDNGLLSERELEEMAEKWAPSQYPRLDSFLNILHAVVGTYKRYLAYRLEYSEDFPRFYVNHTYPKRELENDNEGEEPELFPPFNNMVLERIVKLLKSDYYLEQRK